MNVTQFILTHPDFSDDLLPELIEHFYDLEQSPDDWYEDITEYLLK